MKKGLTIAVFLIGSFIYSFAEEKKQERLDELLQQQTEYICSKIDLTPEEKEKFTPLYNEYQAKRMVMFEKNEVGHFKKIRGRKSYTEAEYQQINEAYINEKLNRATLERIYYEKFREILPESKIYHIFHAEKLYKQDLIKQVENKGRENILNNK